MTASGSWAPFADTVSKVVMPVATLLLSVAVYVGTSHANDVDREVKAQVQCRTDTKQLFDAAEALVDMGAAGGALPGTAGPGIISANDKLVARAQAIDVSGKFLLQECKDAGIIIPANVNRTFCSLGTFVPNTKVANELFDTASDIAAQNNSQRTFDQGGVTVHSGCDETPQTQTPTATGAPPAARASPDDVAKTPQDLTLYIQYPNTMDKQLLDPLIGKIREKGLAGHRIDIPGKQAVAPPTKTTLRCLKAADCAVVKPVAVELSSMLGNADIQVLDLSKRYEARSDVHPGVIELWLDEQDVNRISK